MKFLGIDWGEKRIGLAVSEGSFAEPYGVVSSFAELSEVIRQEGIRQVVLGLPEGQFEKRVGGWGGRIKKELGVSVIFRSEILSTREALAKAIEAGKSQKDRRNLDALSAAVILQEYLDSRKHNRGSES